MNKQGNRLMAFLILLTTFSPLAIAQAIPAIQQSPAFAKFTKRPSSELSKLLYLLDRFKEESDLVIIFEGRQYNYKEALPKAKGYLADHYRQDQNAKAWVEEHCYRSKFSNEIIHLKYPNGSTRLMRDVLLEELEFLEKAASGVKK